MSQDKIQYTLKALLLEEATSSYNLTGNDLIDDLIKELQPSLLQTGPQAKRAKRVIEGFISSSSHRPSKEAIDLLNEELLTTLKGLKQLLKLGNSNVVQATLTWHSFKTKKFIEAYLADEQE